MSSTILAAPIGGYETFDPVDSDLEIDCPKGFEYVDGQLRELNVSYLSSYVAGRLASILSRYVDDNGSGWLAPEGTSFRCFTNTPRKVRRADGAFHLLQRLSAEMATTEGHCTVVPDIAIEVVSPNDSANEVNAKRLEWLRAGVRLLWIVYPNEKEVHVHRADGTMTYLTEPDTLTGEGVLPALEMKLEVIFRLPKAG